MRNAHIQRTAKAAARGAVVCGLFLYGAAGIEASMVTHDANDYGWQAAAASGLPFRNQSTGECLVIPDGRTVSITARSADEECMAGRARADHIKVEGLKNAVKGAAGGGLICGLFVGYRRRQSATKA